MRFRGIKLGAMTGAAALAGGLLMAGPASAAPDCSNCVTGSITIAEALTFTLNNTTLVWTGTPGGPSNAPTVGFTISDNDPNGETTTVEANGNLVPTSGPNFIAIGDISVWGQHQAMGAAAQPAPVGKNYPQSLSSTATTTTELNTVASVNASYLDTYAFLGTAGGFISNVGGTPIGTNIPTNAPPNTYSAQIQYLSLAN